MEVEVSDTGHLCAALGWWTYEVHVSAAWGVLLMTPKGFFAEGLETSFMRVMSLDGGSCWIYSPEARSSRKDTDCQRPGPGTYPSSPQNPLPGPNPLSCR